MDRRRLCQRGNFLELESRGVTIDFGFSPCPNDTFMFWAWVHGQVDTTLQLRPHLADIQELNRLALGHSPLSLTKVSVPTYLAPAVQNSYRLLSSGAALGRGCGPLVVARAPWNEAGPRRIAIPGLNTTAFQLARTALAEAPIEWVETRYDRIMAAVLEGEVDGGVIIHESRFAYQGLGLICGLDLGSWWEEKTGHPLPLGLMVGLKTLGEPILEEVERVLRRSVEIGWHTLNLPAADERRQSLWAYLKDNAIELDEATILSHIELYVTEFSRDLGPAGRSALECFASL